MDKTKKIIAYILLGFSFIGMIVCISSTFDLDLVRTESYTFGRGYEGGASNAPIFYGLCALAGAYLLNGVKANQTNKQEIEAIEE